MLEERTKSIEAQLKIMMLSQNSKTVNHFNYHCEFCDKTFNCKDTIKEHKELKHKANPPVNTKEYSPCEKCDIESEYENRPRVHMPSVHKLKCEQCSYHGSHEKDLKRHVAIMHNREFYCEDCDHVFSSQRILQNHHVTKHNKFASRYFQKQTKTSYTSKPTRTPQTQ